MSIYMSRAELEEISEGLITAYANKFSNRVIQSIDIEHFITEFLMLRIEYASFAEDDAVPAAMNGKPSSKHGSKAVCVLFVLREPFCKVIMILEQLILTYSQNGTLKRTPSGHQAMYRETQ